MPERVSGSLSSGNVTSVDLTVPADTVIQYTDATGMGETKIVHNRATGVVVTNVDGQSPIHFTVDGTAPTVNGANDFVVAAKAGAQVHVTLHVEDEVTVKLISGGDTSFDVALGSIVGLSSNSRVRSGTIHGIEYLTQDEYDAIVAPDSHTLYVLHGAVTPPIVPVNVWDNADPGFTSKSSDSDSYELGTLFHAGVNVTIRGIRIFGSSTDQASFTNRNAAIWNPATGVRKISSFGIDDAPWDGWKVFTLPTPLQILAGTDFLASYTTGGGYGFTAGVFSSASPGNSDVYMLNQTQAEASYSKSNGRLAFATEEFPNESFANSFYGVDVTYTID